MPEWTEDQKKAIFTREEGGIIVSAAAGSGKTAVLTQRIAEYAKEGKDIENLIVVTFTRLAASEIRARTSKEIRNLLKSENNEIIKKSREKFNATKIGTIDSIFGDFVRKNFATLDMSPDFSYLDEPRHIVIKKENLDKLLEECFENHPEGFDEFLLLFGGSEKNDKIEKAINSVYDFAMSIPFFEKWLDGCVEKYDDAKYFTDIACEIAEYEISAKFKAYEDALCFAKTDKDLGKIRTELESLEKVVDFFKKKEWDKGREALFSINFRLIRPNVDNPYINNVYDTARKAIKEFVKKDFFFISTEEVKKELAYNKPAVKCLVSLVKRYYELNRSVYDKFNCYPYEEISKRALSLVVKDYDHKTRKYEPTDLAKSLSEKYLEIMIDEYQDTNGLQDLFFTAISDGGKKLYVVGDVKQSIYGFRRAEPENFIRKQSEFSKINLSKNFRSKKGILDFTNYICSGLFSEEYYNCGYSEDDMLVFGNGNYTENERCDVEIDVVELPPKKRRNLEEEARFCAEKILKLVETGYKIFDKDAKCFRPVKFSDIAILLKSAKSEASVYEKILKSKGIPVVVGKKASIFETPEVNVLIAFLSLINNPSDDRCHVAVMLSEMYSFSEETLAKIKAQNKRKSIYENIKVFAKTDEKTAKYLYDTEHFRLLSENIPVDELIWKILSETDFLVKVSCDFLDGSAREHLLEFYKMAEKYVKSYGEGLYGFISYISGLKEKEYSENEVTTGSFVKIMTCHSSKGLEFPITFLSSLEQSFQTTKENISVENVTGITTNVKSKNGDYEMTTFPLEIARYLINKKEKAEAMRLLYVAMTRARDKLFIVTSASAKNLNSKQYISDENGKIHPTYSSKFSRFEEFIMASLYKYPNLVTETPERCEFSPPKETVSPVVMNFYDCGTYDSCFENEHTETIIKFDIGKVKDRMSKKYDSALTKIPAKISVTEIVKTRYRDDESEILTSSSFEKRVPDFIEKKKSGSDFGTAMHVFLSYADLEKNFEEEKTRLRSEKKLTEKQAEMINEEKISVFKKSGVYDYIKNAKHVYKEEDFVVSVPASFYDQNAKEGNILLQGAMDVLCEYDDGFVLIDYKTDRKDEAELIGKYGLQLYLYSVAAEKMYEKKVKKAIIWSFSMEKGIDITPFFADLMKG